MVVECPTLPGYLWRGLVCINAFPLEGLWDARRETPTGHKSLRRERARNRDEKGARDQRDD